MVSCTLRIVENKQETAEAPKLCKITARLLRDYCEITVRLLQDYCNITANYSDITARLLQIIVRLMRD